MSSRNPQKNIPDVDYADDIAALDDSEAGLQETTTLIARSASDANLKINVSKTKVMCINKHHVQRPYPFEVTLNVNLDGTLLDQVSYFQYLGQTLTCNGSIDKEIDLRIGKASGAFNMLNNIWKNNSIKITTKVDIYSSSTLTVLLYGCSTWPTNERHLQRLEAFQQSCLRRILKVKYFHHVTNVEIRRRTKCQPIHLIISEARLRYFGHAARMPESRFPRYLLTWKPQHGNRSAGRQRKTLMKCIIEDLDMFTESDGMTIEDGIKMAIERNNWRDWLRRSFRRLVENEQANPHG